MPTSTPLPPAELAALLDAIPVAIAGQIINIDYHNSLRSAVLALSRQGTAPTAVTIAPTFLPNGNKSAEAWVVSDGVAQLPVPQDGAAVTSPYGWVSAQLPQGALVKSVRVYGVRASVNGSDFDLIVTLNRVAYSRPTQPEPIVEVALNDVTNFSQGTSKLLGASDAQRIDNATYTYFLAAEAVNAAPALNIRIAGLQVDFA